MKVEIHVQVQIRPQDSYSSAQYLSLSEVQTVQMDTLSDAAAVLVKLHEFFEELKKRGMTR